MDGDRRAQKALYEKNYSFLMSICFRYEKNYQDAVALLNQSFLKIINNLNGYDQTKPFEPWAKRITVNVAIDEFRRKKNHKSQTIYLDNDQWEDESIHIEDGELDTSALNYEDYIAMMNDLDEPARTIFNLFAIDDYKHAEIAEELGISERSSKRYLSKARMALQAMIMERQKVLKRA